VGKFKDFQGLRVIFLMNFNGIGEKE